VIIADGGKSRGGINMKKLAASTMRLAFPAAVTFMVAAAHDAMAAWRFADEMECRECRQCSRRRRGGPEECATLFYNPAGLMKLPGNQFTIFDYRHQTEAKFDNQVGVCAGTRSWAEMVVILEAGWECRRSFRRETSIRTLSEGIGIHRRFGSSQNTKTVGWAATTR